MEFAVRCTGEESTRTQTAAEVVWDSSLCECLANGNRGPVHHWAEPRLSFVPKIRLQQFQGSDESRRMENDSIPMQGKNPRVPQGQIAATGQELFRAKEDSRLEIEFEAEKQR